jgi:GT2 family glycosyltransferase/glycosyltransferase involved in cell wall biosynthesis
MTSTATSLPLQPAYPPLPQPLAGTRTDRQGLKICIASFDFVGPVKNGGVGTAFTSLAEALARAGHSVTCLFLAGDWCENRTLPHWIEDYRKRGIQFVPLPPSTVRCETTWYTGQAYHGYRWLREQSFDIIHFSEWKGTGYFSLLAKHQGLAFAHTTLCVHTHGPTLWHKLSNGEYVNLVDDTQTDYLESRSVQLADVLVSPSQYLLRWMRERDWTLAENSFVQPYVRPATARKPLPDADRCHRIQELVFFGRLEVRKGLVLFCDALDLLKDDPQLSPVSVTFLGKIDKIGRQSSADYLADRAKAWPWKWQIVSDRDQAGAMDYLQESGRLAVLPSLVDNLPNTVLECLGAKVPFIASDTGGIPEMIAAADLESVCFPLRARPFAERIRQALLQGVRPATPAWDSQENEQAWVSWHEHHLSAQAADFCNFSLELPSAEPLVSVCLSHWNRPRYLQQALASIEALDYPNFEVVLVDDGSTDPEAVKLIETLTPDFARRGWQLLRNSENRFPGAARNLAVRHARGEYVMLMDDDNCAKPHELSTFVKVAQKTGADILTCSLDTFSGSEAPRANQPPLSRWVFVGADAATGAVHNCFGDTNSLVRREVFQKLGGFHEDWGVGHEDWEFFAKAVLNGYHLESVPEPLAWYRLNANEQTVNRKTPLQRNHMANIRPYLAAVPPALRNLIYLAQGQNVLLATHGDLAGQVAYLQLSLRWRSLYEAARELYASQQRQAGSKLLKAALTAASATQTPKVLLEALMAVGAEMHAVKDPDAAQVLQLAESLARQFKQTAEAAQAASLLATLSIKHGKPAPVVAAGKAKSKAPPAPPAPAVVPLVSIIIPAFNNLPLTRRCLHSLKANSTPVPHEVIVVDNASTDGTREFLRAEQTAGRLTAFLNEQNTGFAHACNQGAAAARGKYVLFLNNDTEVRSGWLAPLVQTAEADPRIGALGSKLLYPDGTIQHAGVVLLDDRAHGDPLLARHIFAHQPQDWPAANRPAICPALTAACLFVRKDVFVETGGFDEEFWNGYEDVDLCLRIGATGKLLVYQPASVVTHLESQSGPERFRQVRQNVARLHQKWLGKVQPDFVVNGDGQTTATGRGRFADYPPAAAATGSCAASIIILALNQLEHTRACLDSIAAHTPPSHEVIVVDNGSTDATPEFLRKWQAGDARRIVIRNETNRGFAGGNNQGLAIARGETVVLLNNDTIVTPGWLEAMLATLARHPETGVVGPMSNRVSGPQLVSDATYRDVAGLPAFAAGFVRQNAGKSFETGRVVGFCLLARREVIARIGGLDEAFGSGNFEDDDFCIRALLAGFRIRVAQDSFVHHVGSQTFAGQKIDYCQALHRNWAIFHAKWHMPATTSMEKGYPIPKSLPAGVRLQIALPVLSATHQCGADGCWQPRIAAQAPVAAVALVGRLDEARALFGQKKLEAAWQEAITALAHRPYHPEALLLLAEIALAAGDGKASRLCAQRARDYAPGWQAPKQFLAKPLKGNATPEWLVLPESIGNRQSAIGNRLSVCLIVKNEERFLAQCLKSIRGFAAQTVVVDTGSTDRTVEIAREFGAEIYSFPWCDDFSAARNAALEHATGDWVLMLDADEELPAAEHARLLVDMKHASTVAYRLPLANAGKEQEGHSYVPRLFRNVPGAFFKGRIHEQIFASLIGQAKKWGLKTGLGTGVLLHHGYSKDLVVDRNKIERNLKLLRLAVQEDPADVNLVMNLGMELVRSDDLPAGVEKYREAYQLISAQRSEEVVPELREVLLTQFTSQLYKLRAHAEAVQVLTSPLAREGGLTASLHFALGLAYFELKQFSEAADQMRQCLAKRKQPCLTPINTDILTAAPQHCLAVSLVAAGDLQGAEKAFLAALAETGHGEAARRDYAKFLRDQNRPVDALRQLHDVITSDSRDAAAWRMGGEIALSRPEFLEFALDWTAEALRAMPENPIAAAQRGEVLMLNSRPAEALPIWEKIWSSEHEPGALGALVLCETAVGRSAHAPNEGADEQATSRAFVEWYQKLLVARSMVLIQKINGSLEPLSRALPTAAQMLQNALSETDAPLNA